MNLNRLFSAAALVAVTCAAYAGGTTSVSAAGGSVAASEGSGYAGLQGTASTATIQYGTDSSNTQFKFSNGGTTANTLNGVATNGSTTTTTTGQSSITSVPGGTTFYNAQWTSTATSASPTGPVAGSGTYDPWIVTYGDLFDAGVYGTAGTKRLYYQGSLMGGFFDLDPGQTGSYNFVLGEAGHTFVDLTIHSDRSFNTLFTAFSGFDVYLLNPKLVYGPEEDIDYRINNATLLTQANGKTAIDTFLNKYLNQDGSLDYTLSFAIVYTVNLPAWDPNNRDVVIADWNTNTVNATPEPAPMAALGFGALALLRRRKR